MDDRTDPNRPTEGARYDRDLYSWAVEQAALLRAGKIAEADARNIAEELDDVGNEQYDKLESALRVILLHLLKWDHQPEKRTRSWENTIAEQRYRALRQLSKNPSLKSTIEEATREGYKSGRLGASGETDMDLETFPEVCPYDWDTILNRPFKR